MRIGYGIMLAAFLAAPAMAQEFIIQPPNRPAAAQAMGAARDENLEARQDTREARRDRRLEQRDAAHGNYLGAWREQQRMRRELAEAKQEHREARGDVNRARRDDSWKLRVVPY